MALLVGASLPEIQKFVSTAVNIDLSDRDPPLINAVCRPAKDGKSKKGPEKTG